MSIEHNPLSDRLEELLVSFVTEGFNDTEQTEFNQTDWSTLNLDPQQELQQFERSAAAFAVAFDHGVDKSLPDELRRKILDRAKTSFAGTQKLHVGESVVRGFAPTTEIRRETVESVLAPPSWREGLALLAMAACLAIMVFNWNAIFGTGKSYGPVAQLSVAQKRALFIESKPADLVNVAWIQNTDKDAKGNIAWSDSRQEGYMVFDGLDVNDPTVNQYQLWIFEDPNQPYPIDGGVFDVSSTGEVIVPIDAKIPVDKAVQFAVTVEKPGGVVVSERKIIPVLAVVNSAN